MNDFDWGLGQEEEPEVKTARILDNMQQRREFQKDSEIAQQVTNKFLSENPEAQKHMDLVNVELAHIPRNPTEDYRREKALNQAWKKVKGRLDTLDGTPGPAAQP